MTWILTVAVMVFSFWAGRKASEAQGDGNTRKTAVLIGMWLTIYTFYCLFIFNY